MDVGLYSELLGFIDNISLMLIDGDAGDLLNQINDFRNILLKLMCSKKLQEGYQNEEIEMEDNSNIRNEKWNYYL